MSKRALNKHALEMLRLIGSRPNFWHPHDKHDGGEDEAGHFSVFVMGPWSTGAIATLTSRGLVETVSAVPDSGAGKWARRITPSGRKLLAEHLTPLVEKRRADFAVLRQNQDDGW